MDKNTAVSDYSSLELRLQQLEDSTDEAEHRLATLFRSDPEGTALRTFAETHRLAQVTPQALTIFIESLGFNSYDKFILIFKTWLKEQLNIENQLDPETVGALSTLLLTVLAKERANLLKTVARINPKQWKDAVGLLTAAKQIHIIGLRKSLPVAQLLASQLRLVRPGINLLTPLEGSLTDALSALNTKEVLVAIAVKKYTRQTVRAVEYAKRRGLVTIALTDSEESPLHELADITFIAETGSVTVLKSITSMITIAQALVTATALKRGTEARSSWQTDEKLLAEFGVYHEASEESSE